MNWPEHVLPAVDDLLNLPALPQQLQGHQAGLVVRVLEARLPAGDDVELVVSQLQGSMYPDSYSNTSLLSFL